MWNKTKKALEGSVPKIHINKSIYFRVPILTNTEERPLAGRDLRVELLTPMRSRMQIEEYETDGNVLSFYFLGEDHPCCGMYMLRIWEDMGKRTQTVFDENIVELVPFTRNERPSSQDEGLDYEEVILEPVNIAVGIKGDKPVRGVDYWTEEDKTEILSEVRQILESKADRSELDRKQDKLIEGDNIKIEDNVISSTAVGGTACSVDEDGYVRVGIVSSVRIEDGYVIINE